MLWMNIYKHNVIYIYKLIENTKTSKSRLFFRRTKMFSTPTLLHVSQAETITRSARRQTPNGLTAI